MYADKGYIGKEFVQKMKNKGIDLSRTQVKFGLT